MTAPHGAFVWYELMTTDEPAARDFYSHVAGWSAQVTDIAGPPYTLFSVADAPVAGMMDLPADARARGVPPCWVGYVGVDDVDASAAQAKALGGTVHVEPRDIPNVGRFAMIQDPQGASIAVFRFLTACPAAPPAMGTPGQFGWHELMAVDWTTAFPFYAEMFGWQKSTPVDMGPMGTYQLFAIGGQDVGGMMSKPPAIPVPFWLYYINVANIDDAIARVVDGGGQVLNGPMQVPGGTWIAQCRDPQGAMFAMAGSRG
ncbi:MAG: VOC family protein [Acetobacteraceae bacterium]|nr:VOC family protein [Acetobacteraceae bacterium]